MRFTKGTVLTAAAAAAALVIIPASILAQGRAPAAPAAAEESSRSIAGGGITVAGWTGKVDDNEAKAGMTTDNAKFASEDGGIHVITGPATTYWNPANKASGDYTVKATFFEPKFMNLNTHPHPYGIMIAASDPGTATQSMLYCAAYGNGNFIVRGFGPAAFQMNGRMGGASPAVHKAAGVGQPVTQDIAMSVKGDSVSCSINGQVVASYSKAELLTAGKLKSTDGIYGLRFAHNTEVIVKDFGMTKN